MNFEEIDNNDRWDDYDIALKEQSEATQNSEKLLCPRCNSEDYGEEEDGTMTCMGCKLGFDNSDNNREYQAQYAYACGYYD